MTRVLPAALVSLVAAGSAGCIIPLPHRAFFLIIPTVAIQANANSAKADPEDEEVPPPPRGAPGPPAPNTSSPPFDRGAARASIAAAMARAAQECHPPAVRGAAVLTYEPGGSVASIEIDPPLADDAAEECLSNVLLGASIHAFAGAPVAVKKRFSFVP